MDIRLSCNYYLLGLIVEGDLLPALDGGDIHAQRNGVRVAGADAGVGSFARAHALHPVAHVGVRLWIAATAAGGIGVGRYLLHLIHQREAGQLIRLHLHGGRFTRAETSGGCDRLFVHVDHAAVGVVELLHSAGGVGEARGVLHLEALGQVIERAVVEDGGHGVPVGAAVLPQVDAAVGDHRARVRQAGEPVDGVDLVNQPLIGDAGGVGPVVK